MVQAVHSSQPITQSVLCLLGGIAAKREVEVAGQVVITHPPIAGSPIRFSEQPAIGISGDGDAAFMHDGVMPLTQQDQIIQALLGVP